MNTIILPTKEYKDSLRVQQDILSRLDFLQKFVFENAKDEINNDLSVKLQKISLNLDKNNGKSFSSIVTFKKYLKNI